MVTERRFVRRWSRSLTVLLCCSGAGVVSAACGFSGTTTDGGTAGTTAATAGGSSSTAGNSPGTAGVNPGTGGVVTGQAGSVTNTMAGATPTAGAATTAGAGGGGPMGTNYEYSGTWPKAPMAVATKPGKLTYTKKVIHSQFLAESCSIADYNNDGIPDVSSGPQWYEGTNDPQTAFKTAHAFRNGHDALPRTGNANELFAGLSDDWADYPVDIDGDGWTDIINVAPPNVYGFNAAPEFQPPGWASWYRNPGPDLPADPTWTRSLIHADVQMIQRGFADMNGDGFPELLGACKTCMPIETKGYYQADRTHPTEPWTYHPVTGRFPFPFGGSGTLNGIGAGDVNGDGSADFLERSGVWLQQTDQAWNATVCTGSDVPTGCGKIAEDITDDVQDPDGIRGPSHIYATDMDGDGLTDLVAADSNYDGGLAWYRQTAGMKFVKYYFMGSAGGLDIEQWGVGFSEPTAVQVVDMDGDGAPDVITGKMRFALPDGQGIIDPDGAPYVYVFKNLRGKVDDRTGSPITLEPHKVDGDPDAVPGTTDAGMGVGRQIAVGHVNTDGIPDICVASKVGLAVFLGQ